jgi:hypothetical protein
VFAQGCAHGALSRLFSHSGMGKTNGAAIAQ